MLFVFCLAAAFAVGTLAPLQTSLNSTVRAQLSSPLLASFVNCAVGAACLTLLMLAASESFYRPVSVWAALPWWMYSSGPLGAAILVTALVLLPRLGLVGSTLAVMSGMLISGLICDHFALLGLERHPFTLLRAAGLVLVITGILGALQALSFIRAHAAGIKPASLLWFALGALSGTCSTLQAAVNAQVRLSLNSMLLTGLLSMSVTALLALLLAACLGHSPRRLAALKIKGRLPYYAGGLLGAASLVGSALIMPLIGAGAMMTLVIAGQLFCSMLLDHLALFGLKRRPFTVGKAVGLVLILFGLICIRVL